GDSGGDSGSDDGGDDGGDEFASEDFIEWLSEGQGGAGIEIYQQQGAVTWISSEEEQSLIAAQWNQPYSRSVRSIARQGAVVRPSVMVADSVNKVVQKETESLFPRDQLQLHYSRIVEQSEHDIAVVIGNANYKQFGSSVPNVTPAYADAEAFTRFAREGLGVREGNMIQLKDATQAQMNRLFGTQQYPQGQLYDWVKPGQSRVYLYFSGHGAPGEQEHNYLVPADADGARLALNGFPLEQLYQNLSQLKARSVTVVLEACFSGLSQESKVVTHASPIFVRQRPTAVPENITLIAAGSAEQIASWEQDRSHGLFTKYYLKAMSGEADQSPIGNGDGEVSLDEVKQYLQETMTYWARRYYGREQVVQIQSSSTQGGVQ
ncbi:MAG: caspase family protein, partial [Gammaproteobacteria bacterium]|nr:caspase family protein [Gammaproteobacteria bacterium]